MNKKQLIVAWVMAIISVLSCAYIFFRLDFIKKEAGIGVVEILDEPLPVKNIEEAYRIAERRNRMQLNTYKLLATHEVVKISAIFFSSFIIGGFLIYTLKGKKK